MRTLKPYIRTYVIFNMYVFNYNSLNNTTISAKSFLPIIYIKPIKSNAVKNIYVAGCFQTSRSQ